MDSNKRIAITESIHDLLRLLNEQVVFTGRGVTTSLEIRDLVIELSEDDSSTEFRGEGYFDEAKDMISLAKASLSRASTLVSEFDIENVDDCYWVKEHLQLFHKQVRDLLMQAESKKITLGLK